MLDSIIVCLGPLFGTVVGSFAVYKYGISRYKIEEKRKLTLQKIIEFYSPLVLLKKEIKTILELKKEYRHEGDIACRNRDLCTYDTPEARKKYTKKVEKAQEYDNSTTIKEILPKYDEMLKIFKEKYWLAESSTQKFYNSFSKHVKKEHDWYYIDTHINYNDKEIESFYKNLEKNLNKLNNKLK